MIDPIISLAFSMYSGKGVYALLLGSGVSRSAQIPTGWEITLDLVRQLAALTDQETGEDVLVWYKERFGVEAEYSALLDVVARTPTERNALLRRYFEPTEEERERGSKVPTAAHVAISQLVAGGYVRVIVTTNFDRLLEKALEADGIAPTVIHTSDAVKGALPLQHTACTIVKVNGDYLDTRIRNTTTELESYDPVTDQLLDRIFDEYGLIICGWSGEWDLALRSAIERCPSRRFSKFWTSRPDLTERAKQLITLSGAVNIPIESADSFFKELLLKVSALEAVSRPHPLSTKAAIASAKRCLADDRYRIDLHDLFAKETEDLFAQISGCDFRVDIGWQVDELIHRVERYESLAQTLIGLIVVGSSWARGNQTDLLTVSIKRILDSASQRSGQSAWINLRRYPALLLAYAGGIASLAKGNYGALAALLIQGRCRWANTTEPVAVANILVPGRVITRDTARLLPGRDRKHVPLSEQLFEYLREPLSEVLPGNEEYDLTFDDFGAREEGASCAR